MDISIIIGLVTIWLTILVFMLALKKDFKESEESIRKDLGEKITNLEGNIKRVEDSIKVETRDIRREIASLYRLLISQGKHYEDPEDKKIA